MKKQLLFPIFLFLLINSGYSQVVSGGSQLQPTTVKPGELGGSSFNGDVNLFTGTYGGNYTLGSVATPGGLKYDVNMVYSSTFSGGDNVPIAAGIPYGEGWSVEVPTISVSVTEFASYNSQELADDAVIYNSLQGIQGDLDPDKNFGNGNGRLYWFAPMVNIPGVASGRAVFKFLDQNTQAPIFVLQTFDQQYIEILYNNNQWEVFLPDGTTYLFGGGTVSYRKGYNRRIYDYSEDFTVKSQITGNSAVNNSVEDNIKPKGETINWHCSRIANRNMPHQFIMFTYEGYGKFNFFKEFSFDHMPLINQALNHNPLTINNGLPGLEVSTDVYLKKVISTYKEIIDQVELEYGTEEQFGKNMLDHRINPEVHRLDSMYNYKSVYYMGAGANSNFYTPLIDVDAGNYTQNDHEFNGWKRYRHSKHEDIVSFDPTFDASNINTDAINPYIGRFSSTGPVPVNTPQYFIDNVQTNSTSVPIDDSFLESPRINGTDGYGIKDIVGGDIYEIRTFVSGDASNHAYGFVNIDINIATGPDFNGSLSPVEVVHTGFLGNLTNANVKNDHYTNESIFSTFGNAVKWNPIATGIGNGTMVETSNFFTMGNVPTEYGGVTIQIGPANSDSYHDINPYDFSNFTTTSDLDNAHRSYWQQNNPYSIPRWTHHTRQPYDPVPHSFGIGLPWMMMKPIAHRMLDNSNPVESHPLYDFWWNDGKNLTPGFIDHPNRPTLADENTVVSAVELIRYSKNPYMLQSVKTYKTNGELTDSSHPNPGKILVNQFDLDYNLDTLPVVNNEDYTVGDQPVYNGDNYANIYLLENIKNVPVNGSQDIANILPSTTDEVPTTHFEYEEIEPGTPWIIKHGTDHIVLRSNASLFLLNKLTTHLGKETTINYYSIQDTVGRSSVGFLFMGAIRTISGSLLNFTPTIAERNFGVQINMRVQSINVSDPTNTKQWDYEYDLAVARPGVSGSFNSLNTSLGNGTTFSSARGVGGKGGWQTVKITEPEINSLRPYSIYHHHGELALGSPSPVINSDESRLIGKLKKVENFDGNGVKLSQKDITYKVTKAFTNGINRPGYYWRADLQGYTAGDTINTFSVLDGDTTFITTSFPGGVLTYTLTNKDTTYDFLQLPTTTVDFWYYDYQDIDEGIIGDPLIVEEHRPQINTGMGQNTVIAAPSTYLETAFSQFAHDSYFIRKIKEIDTEYETTVCNIPDIDITDDPTSDPETQAAAYPPLDPILVITTKEGDASLVNIINSKRFGKNIEGYLVAASPLSLDVLNAVFDKRPFYKYKTYNKIVEAQPILNSTIFSKILLLPKSTRDKVIGTALVNQEYKLSENILRDLIAIQPPLDEAIINNSLNQYNSLPEDILLSIVNRNPKYSEEFIQSVLLNQVQLSEELHNLLLNKNYLKDNVIKNVFVNGATYPVENTLVTMINRTPNIEVDVIEKVLLASSYQHTPNTMGALNAKFGAGSAISSVVTEHDKSKPTWSVYCGNASNSAPLSIQNITEFEYWDANELGETSSDGFMKLMDVDPTIHPTIDLMFEPSWQLYKTKSYSPQLSGAFTEKEYFYYYDLKNKYRRREQYIPNNTPTPNPDYFYVDEAAVDVLTPVLAVQEFDIIFNDPTGSPYAFNDGTNSLRGFLPPGLGLSHQLNLLNIAYQERTTSKNVSDVAPIQRSTFYHYDNRWNEIIDDVTTLEIPYSLGEGCPTPTSTGDPFIDGGCSSVFKLHLLDVSQVSPGNLVYITNQSTVYICPCELDVTGLGVIQTFYDNCITPNNSGARMIFTNDLDGALLLKEVNTQIDTLINDNYFDSLAYIPFPSSTGLMEFKYGREDPIYTNNVLYDVVYPFDVLNVKKIKERNHFTQVQLEENEQGLLTRYYYTNSKNIWYNNTDCSGSTFGNYTGIRSFNIGVPIAITVGFTRSDSLRTDYEYFPDYSVKRIIDPNGITLSYKYDEYGRLKESYRNNELLSINKYSTWDNDFSATFLDRSTQNYVETFQLKDKGNGAALQSRKYIDPIGRDFHTMSTEVNDYLSTGTPTQVTHTGEIVYDNWNRAIETYKPFVSTTGVFAPELHSTTNTTLYPDISSAASYEDNQKSRVLRESKPGEDFITPEHVKYRYAMANYVCGGCELELTAQESNLIMGTSPNGVRFKVVEVEDEDGKISKEYFNALGQKVATKQFIGTEEAITLFIYDSYGNLTKVINPEKQESSYDYNMLGWLFQKETVDGGITKYMFNESGQVVLEQDENAKVERSCTTMTITNPDGSTTTDFIDRPYYREYTYDIFGRLTKQSKVNYEIPLNTIITEQLPMLYNSVYKNILISNVSTSNNYDLYHDGLFYEGDAIADPTLFGQNAFVYKFTNNSTYEWMAKSYIWRQIPLNPGSYIGFTSEDNFGMIEFNQHHPEKELFYGEAIPASSFFHAPTNTILNDGRINLKGNLGFAVTYNNSYCEKVSLPVKYDIYNYNSDGNLIWQMQQFNANGIDDDNKGLVTRIDYPKYDLNNNLLVENIDVNNDLVLDLQYNYSYDLRNRLKEVRVGLTDNNTRELLASYDYNDATGLVTETNYHKECSENDSKNIDQIDYIYDVRDRLTNINSNFFDYTLSYDNDMPNTPLSTPLATIANFNGNINGTQADYKFLGNMTGYVSGMNFEEPTSYAFKYDGINRLNDANAYWDETNPTGGTISSRTYGDVTFSYDKIGNITNLNRIIDASNGYEEWDYKYQAGTNILKQVESQNASIAANRNYTYDAAGNLLTDDFRNVNQSIYGRANLPFDLDLGSTEATRYLYDASDARIFKGLYDVTLDDELGIDVGMVKNAEYYLRDAAGNTVGILDLNSGEWIWYVFGRERFAKIKPNVDQQPEFFPTDNERKGDVINDPEGYKQQFIDEVKAVLNSSPEIQTQLLKVECSDGKSFWLCEDNLPAFTDTVPDTSYTIVQEIMLTNKNQMVVMDDKMISVGVLTGKDTIIADSIVVDTSAMKHNEREVVVIYDPYTGFGKQIVGEIKGDPFFEYTFFTDTLLTDMSYYIHDHLGNTRVVYTLDSIDCSLDNPYGYVLEYAADYYPYGKILREFNPKAEKYLTTHHERDTETGLDYRGARYYDADVARFLSLDPNAADYVHWNPYVYVRDNPIRFIDPDGKDWLDAVAGALAGAVSNVIPGTTAIRNFYKPNDASTYNNTLRNTDNAFIVLGVGLTVAGIDVAAAGGTATVTVVGAPVGVPAAGIGLAVAGTGTVMTINATVNKSQGYNYGKGKNSGGSSSKSNGTKSNSKQKGQKSGDKASEQYEGISKAKDKKGQLSKGKGKQNEIQSIKKTKQNEKSTFKRIKSSKDVDDFYD